MGGLGRPHLEHADDGRFGLRVEISDAEILPGPTLVVVQRRRAFVQAAQARDAERRRVERDRDVLEQIAGDDRGLRHRATHRPQEQQLQRPGDASIGAESIRDGGDVRFGQLEELFEVEIREA